ncbi:hypothetical protein BC828DRAFT_392606 [Blastocladiella britannica]|nr:hypothetical protein BC828DRAFT_392606 [Blastocladiella britannica]
MTTHCPRTLPPWAAIISAGLGGALVGGMVAAALATAVLSRRQRAAAGSTMVVRTPIGSAAAAVPSCAAVTAVASEPQAEVDHHDRPDEENKKDTRHGAKNRSASSAMDSGIAMSPVAADPALVLDSASFTSPSVSVRSLRLPAVVVGSTPYPPLSPTTSKDLRLHRKDISAAWALRPEDVPLPPSPSPSSSSLPWLTPNVPPSLLALPRLDLDDWADLVD